MNGFGADLVDIRRQWQIAVILCGVIFSLGIGVFGDARSSDLMATWLAGHYFAEGRPDLIYMAAEPVFTMRVHDEWYAYMKQSYGYDDPLFPFIYPPLWAWVASFFHEISFFDIEPYATAVNMGLLLGMIMLSARMVSDHPSPLLHVVACLLLLFGTHIGFLALYENQPQILVSFLIILALERARNGGPIVAGIALALAASLKIYPAFLALLWLATGQRRAFSVFCVIGGGLGLMSLLTAGWPLHQQFLHQIGNVAAGSIVVTINWNLHALLATICCSADFTYIAFTEIDTDQGGWYMFEKPALWAGLTTALPILVTLAAVPFFRKADPDARDQGLWPAFLIVLALTAPIAWVYHYLPVVVLAPLLMVRLGKRLGLMAIVGTLALISLPAVFLFGTLGLPNMLFLFFGVTAMVGLLALFIRAARAGSSHQPEQDLRPQSAPL